jgi:2-oxo-3-hexenedioate decarboxylase
VEIVDLDGDSESAVFALGTTWIQPVEIDLTLLGCIVEADGEVVASGAGAAALGHPAESVARLVGWLAGFEEAVEPGWVVLTGGLTDPVPLGAGGVAATFARLGTVQVRR